VLNGAGARALLAAEELAPEHGYRDAAERILKSLGEKYKQYTYFSAGYALAVELFENGFIEVRISNETDEDTRKEIVRAATVAFSPRKLVRPETVEDFLPAEADGRLPIPAAVVCSPAMCLPVNSAAGLAEAVGSLSGSHGVAGGTAEPFDGE